MAHMGSLLPSLAVDFFMWHKLLPIQYGQNSWETQVEGGTIESPLGILFGSLKENSSVNTGQPGCHSDI